MLQDARRGLTRLTAKQAAAALQDGALLIDIRSSEQRCREGEIPGSIVIDRNVLEWRLDPSSQHRIPQLVDREAGTDLIIICSEGYSSSLAAASLKRLGLRHVQDVIGGFQGWVASGLPVRRRTSLTVEAEVVEPEG
jgi:rhodanese-related sulfurtransferase